MKRGDGRKDAKYGHGGMRGNEKRQKLAKMGE
jgi:hypothetical protein